MRILVEIKNNTELKTSFKLNSKESESLTFKALLLCLRKLLRKEDKKS